VISNVNSSQGVNWICEVPSDKPIVQALVSSETKKRLEQKARRNDRSLSKEAGDALERYVDKNTLSVKVPPKIYKELEKLAKNEESDIESYVQWLLIEHCQKLTINE
jgi:predicted DNA-binding protein (UPF0278 family)